MLRCFTVIAGMAWSLQLLHRNLGNSFATPVPGHYAAGRTYSKLALPQHLYVVLLSMLSDYCVSTWVIA